MEEVIVSETSEYWRLDLLDELVPFGGWLGVLPFELPALVPAEGFVLFLVGTDSWVNCVPKDQKRNWKIWKMERKTVYFIFLPEVSESSCLVLQGDNDSHKLFFTECNGELELCEEFWLPEGLFPHLLLPD